jgi:N-acyl-D-aspartate/D-glutamate deacylase
MFDLLLKNGDVYDGSGRVVCGQDIAIQDGMIVDIGKNLTGIAQQTIDASGLIVSPGFIDMHTHSDFTLIADGRAESQVHQGVTTEVIGQCGISCAPVVSKDSIKHVSPWFTSKASIKDG